MNIVEKAKMLATIAHDGQVRKYTFEPYINHCEEVAHILTCHAPHLEDEVYAAAWMHDVVEDTPITIDMVELLLGYHIATFVDDLTDCPLSAGNREQRKRFDRHRLRYSSSEAKTIKCADLISNTKSIVEHDPNFARVYLKEKELLLREALIGADIGIYQMAFESLERAKRILENSEI